MIIYGRPKATSLGNQLGGGLIGCGSIDLPAWEEALEVVIFSDVDGNGDSEPSKKKLWFPEIAWRGL